MSQILSPSELDAPAELLRRPITVDEFHRMAETGILREDERIELIEGELVPMSPIGDMHHWTLVLIDRILRGQLGSKYPVAVQGPLRLDKLSCVQPDLAILRSFPVRRAGFQSGPADVLLLIEVAHSSLAHDRNVKLPLSARAGVREVWIVDVEASTISVHLDPSPGGYASNSMHGPDSRLKCAAIPELEVDFTEVFK